MHTPHLKAHTKTRGSQGKILPSGIYYECHGHGPALMLIHGIAGGAEMWYHLLPELAKQYTVIIPEMRGHGRSQDAAPIASIGQIAADFWAVLDAEKIEKASILGLSMGGTVAQAMAKRAETRVSGLILVSTFAFKQISWIEQWTPSLAPAAIRAITTKRLAHLNGIFGTGGLRPDERFVDLIKALFAANEDEHMVAASQAIFRFDSRTWLPTLHCPTLVLQGSADLVVPPHHGRMLHTLIQKAEFHICDNAGHAMFYTHAQWLLNRVSPFLEKHTTQKQIQPSQEG